MKNDNVSVSPDLLAKTKRRKSSKSSGKLRGKRSGQKRTPKEPSHANPNEVEIEFDVIEEDEDGNESEEEEIYEILMMSASGRQKWKTKIEYFMVTLSYLVGLDHILSYLALFNSYGVTMFIPYFVCLIVFGIPVLYLEMALGQYSSLDSFLLFERLAPAMAGTGYASTILALLGMVSNEGMAAVALESVFSSTNEVLLRSRIYFDGCHSEYNSEDCLDPQVIGFCFNSSMVYSGGSCLNRETVDLTTVQYAEHIYMEGLANRKKSPIYQYILLNLLGLYDYSTPFQPPVNVFFFSAFGFVILVYFGMKGIRAMVKLSFFTFLFPLGIMILFTIVVFVSMDGPTTRLNYSFGFEAAHLLEPKLWVRSVGHMFTALKLGQGGVITLGTYNNFHNDVLFDMVIIVAVAFFVPLFFTFAISSIYAVFIDHLHKSESRFDEQLKKMFDFNDFDIFVMAGNGLRLIPTFGAAFLTLAFICLFMLALGNMITRLKLVTNALSEKIEILRQPQNIAVTAAIIMLMSVSLTFTFFCYHGAIFYQVTYLYTVPAASICVVLFETITVAACYGAKQMFANTHVMIFGEKESRLMNEEQQGFKGKVLPYVNFYLIAMLRGPVIVVLTLTVGFMTYGLYSTSMDNAAATPTFKIAFWFGIGSLFAVVGVIPVILCYKIVSTKIQKRPLVRLFKPHLKLWAPQEKSKRNIVDKFEKRLRVVH